MKCAYTCQLCRITPCQKNKICSPTVMIKFHAHVCLYTYAHNLPIVVIHSQDTAWIIYKCLQIRSIERHAIYVAISRKEHMWCAAEEIK